MPFLLPPTEFSVPDLDAQGLGGTCEVQLCRSAGNWSMGFQNYTEQSIQNAYLKGLAHSGTSESIVLPYDLAIQMSEHFVYIENQFFITRYNCQWTVILYLTCDVKHRSKRSKNRESNRRRHRQPYYPCSPRTHIMEGVHYSAAPAWVHIPY